MDFQKFIEHVEDNKNTQTRVAKFTDEQIQRLEAVSKAMGVSFGEAVMIYVQVALGMADRLTNNKMENRNN